MRVRVLIRISGLNWSIHTFMVWTLDPFDGVGRKNIVLDSAVNIANDEEIMRSSNSMWELGSRFVISVFPLILLLTC